MKLPLLPLPLLLLSVVLLVLLGTAPSLVDAFTVPLPHSSTLVSSSSFSTASPPTRSFVCLSAKKASKSDSKKRKRRAERNKSRVVDKDGPTVEWEETGPEDLDPSELPNLEYDPDDHPVPHQPWRRGETAGCHEPIHAPWRQRAEFIIRTAASEAGAQVRDVTWYLTGVIITIDNELSQVDPTEIGGPEVRVVEAQGPDYTDPNNPEPEDIYLDDDEEEEDMIAWERVVDKEFDIKKRSIVPRDEDDEDDDDTLERELEMEREMVSLEATTETRTDLMEPTEDEQVELDSEPYPMSQGMFRVDTTRISVVAKYIIKALEAEEGELRILERHEVILSTPGASDVLETQRQFDAYRGFDVIVETVDPFDSNRVLRGKLLERNAMDLIINKKGRMVTIPLNFVQAVRLPPAKREKGVPRDTPF